MTENEARASFVDELLRHEKRIMGGASLGEIHDSRSLVYMAEHRYQAVRFAALLERWKDKTPEIARLSLAILNDEPAQLTPSDGGA